MKKVLFLLLIFSTHLCVAQDYLRDTVYFNAKWEKGTKENHTYYRLLFTDTITMAPEKVIRIRDHYRSGILEMEGYVLAEDTSKRVGLYTQYNEKGRLARLYLYDYKRYARYFLKSCSYLKKIEACDSNVDLGITVYKDGHMKHSGFYLANNELGTSKWRMMCTCRRYNPYTENIEEISDYSHGKLDGRHFKYHGNGKLWKEEYYKDGIKTGVWKKYRYDGSLRKKIVVSK